MILSGEGQVSASEGSGCFGTGVYIYISCTTIIYLYHSYFSKSMFVILRDIRLVEKAFLNKVCALLIRCIKIESHYIFVKCKCTKARFSFCNIKFQK